MLNHVAIIMDGNGRWAKARRMPLLAGHRQGAEAAKKTIQACRDFGIKYLTLYAFSSENWGRPQDEVEDLMNLLRHYLGSDKEINKLHDKGIRIRIVGDKQKFSDDILGRISYIEKLTEANDEGYLNLALSYGGRQEIAYAARRIAEDVKAGNVSVDGVNEELVASCLYTRDIPDPDLLIRTGGEQRISNFLLWQSAYTELYFTETLWPDFDKNELGKAVDEFNNRERRFGGR